MDGGAWQATVHWVARELDMTERLKNDNKPAASLLLNTCLPTSWAWNKDAALLYCLHKVYIKYTYGGAHTWPRAPDLWTYVRSRLHLWKFTAWRFVSRRLTVHPVSASSCSGREVVSYFTVIPTEHSWNQRSLLVTWGKIKEMLTFRRGFHHLCGREIGPSWTTLWLRSVPQNSPWWWTCPAASLIQSLLPQRAFELLRCGQWVRDWFNFNRSIYT